MRISAALQLKLDTLPTSPGVYQFKDKTGRIIYIGKAKNLRARVRTYFQSSSRLDQKTARLVAHVADLELLVTDSEIESLILEANLVHEYKPRYNVRLRDDKHFPYIKVTTNEPFPRVFVVRRLEQDGASYFGPYTSAKSMRMILQLLTRLFKIRTCNLVIPAPEGKKYQVCLDYHIKRCGGPCEGYQSQEEYAELVNAVVMVLRGKSTAIIADLEQRMQAAAEATEFETAAELRDQVQALKNMQHRQSVDVGEMVDRDIVSLAREDAVAVAVVMQIREGALIGRQDFQLEVDAEDTDETILDSFVTQYYHAQPNLPSELCLPLDIQDVSLIEAWLRQSKGEKVTVVTPRIGQKSKLVALAARNARLLLDELLIQKRSHSDRTSKMVSALQDQLKLPRAPRRMICFDISNTGETDAVGSGAFFDNGRPKKSEYRHFKIKGVRGQDDFKMMREVIGRYFHRLKEEDKPPPDLVVVDGGKGQLSSAKQELASLGFETQPIISLAKRLEEVFLPGMSEPITIPRSSPALLLLKRIRDEAHRFAITYNRKVRTKRTIKSALDDIPGIGPAKRESLLRTFGSVARIKELSVEELTAAKGISPKIAETVKKHLGRM